MSNSEQFSKQQKLLEYLEQAVEEQQQVGSTTRFCSSTAQMGGRGCSWKGGHTSQTNSYVLTNEQAFFTSFRSVLSFIDRVNQ